MVSSIQPASQVYSNQQLSSVSQQSKQPAASLPQDTVTLSETMKDAKAGLKGTMPGGPADVDHDGDSH